MKKYLGHCAILILCLGFLAACAPEDSSTEKFDEDQCQTLGGTVGTGGLLGLPVCYMPTDDAGKTCKGSNDCQGLCLAQEGHGICAPQDPQFGCIDIMEDGQKVTICID